MAEYPQTGRIRNQRAEHYQLAECKMADRVITDWQNAQLLADYPQAGRILTGRQKTQWLALLEECSSRWQKTHLAAIISTGIPTGLQNTRQLVEDHLLEAVG